MPIRPSRKKPKEFDRAHEVMTKPKGPKYQFLAPADFPQGNQDKIGPREIWQGMKEYTTAHGIPHLSRAQGIVKKTFWAIMVMAMVGALLFNMINISTSFFSYNVDVTIKLLHQTELTFPAVTICNMSPVRASALSGKKKKRKKRAVSVCGVGWIDFGESCYSFSNDKKNHNSASNMCTSLSAELATIETSAENDFIKSQIGGDRVYMGLENNGTDWVWGSGSTASFRDWRSDEPNHSGDCVTIEKSNDNWRDISCNTIYKYVCERSIATTVIQSTEALTTLGETTVKPTTPITDTTRQPETTARESTVAETTIPASTLSTDDKSTFHIHPSSTPLTTYGLETTSAIYITTKGENAIVTTDFDTSSAEFSTVADTNVTGSCCCTCCFAADLLGSTCNTCSASTVSAASSCASTITTPTPAPAPAPTPAPSTTPAPAQLEGSTFDRPAPREDFMAEEALTEALAAMSESEKKALGFQPDQMILDCKYAGSVCSLSQFSQYYNPIHGNCYIFNGGWESNMTLVKSMKAGRRHGLHLVVNIGQDEYVKQVGDTAGLRLVVHPQERMPFPEDEGLMVTPGIATSIGLRQLLIERQSHPYGNCIDPTVSNITKNVFEEIYKVQYSASACMKTCYQREVINTCGCADPYYPYRGAAFSYKDVSVCSSANLTQDDCKYAVGLRYNKNEIKCDCPDSCEDMSYPTSLSLGLWPSNVMRDDIAKMAEPLIGEAFDVYDPQKISENLVKLEVYFEEFNFELISERPAYTPGNYLGDIGGVLGLWVGFSILTIFEFFELAMDMIVLGIVRRCKCFTKATPSGTGNNITPKAGQDQKGFPSQPTNSGPQPKSKQSLLSAYHNSIVPPSDGAIPPTDAGKKEQYDIGYTRPGKGNNKSDIEMPTRTPPPPYSSHGRPGRAPPKPLTPFTKQEDGVDVLLNL